MTARFSTFVRAAVASLVFPAHYSEAAPTRLGDLNGDALSDVRDLVLLRGHLSGTRPLSATDAPFADLNKDGFVNDTDSDELIKEILGTRTPEALPLAGVRDSSPFSGESGVSLTREVVVRFTIPLAPATVVTTWDANTQTPGTFYAEAGGRKLLTRAELSGDYTKATLFFLEPVPASTRVTVTFDGTGIKDLLNRAIDAENDGFQGGTFTFRYDTAPITPVAGTGIIGKVLASERAPGQTTDTPLAGALVRVVGSETVFTFTGADGSFNLNPCPAGRFFVEVDGRTCPVSHFPDGGYYPYIIKAWEALPGKADNLAATTGKIYLPFVPANTLQAVSATAQTTIGFPPSVTASNPALAGVEIYVPPNSLSSDDGTRGGKVGLAVVASDRLPEPLPPGLNHALDISIQTDGGTNFDRPVPVKFPNLPDPVTGKKLPPGAKSALWSFNHDKGAWEIAGPMTVTADGNFVVTDVGVGVRQPGWHGTNPGTTPQPDSGVPAKIPEVPPEEPVPDPTRPPPDPCAGLYHSVGSLWKAMVDFFACDRELTPGVLAGALENYSLIADDALEQRTELTRVSALLNGFDSNGNHTDRLQKLSQAQTILATASATICPRLHSRLDRTSEVPDLSGRLTGIQQCVAAKEQWIQAVLAQFHAEYQKHLGDPCIQNLVYVLYITYVGTEYAQATAGLTPIAKKLEEQAEIADGCEDLGTISSLLADGILAEQASNSAGANAKASAALTAANVKIAQWVAIKNYRDEINRYLAPLNQHVDNLLAMIAAMSDIVQNHSGPSRVQTWFRIQGPNLDLRGRSNPDGSINRVLPPDEFITVEIYDPVNKQSGKVVCRTGGNGTQFRIPFILTSESESPDSDGDGLRDDDERIVGTSPLIPDTDGDGIPDGAEVGQGLNPLDNVAAATGVLATIDTPGIARDIAAQGTAAILADGAEGVSVFNVAAALNPVRTAQIRLDGSTEALAIEGTLGAAANARLVLLDLSDLSSVRATKQRALGARPLGVAIANGVAYAGLDNGQVVAVDIAEGLELDRLQVSPEAIQDLSFAGDVLYVRTVSRVFAIELAPEGMKAAGSVAVAGGSAGRLRLFAGGGLIYAPMDRGYTILSIADALHPALVDTVTVVQFGWREFVPTGSGLGLGIFTNLISADLHLYNIGPSGTNSGFLTTFDTPGDAHAVSIFNGLAYVADGEAGLTAVNYKAYDTLGVPPTIALSTNFDFDQNGLMTEGGKPGRLSAVVGDDVQVRNVEFYLDGQLAAVDGNFPFEYRFTTPLRRPDKTSFVLRAKATDTGGNATWGETINVNLLPDTTPPRVVRFYPETHSITGAQRNAGAVFSEPINTATLTPDAFMLRGAGNDGIFGTGDDFVPQGGTLALRDTTNTVFLTFPADLPPGRYRLIASALIADLAGNLLAATSKAEFNVYSFSDADGDGIPDDKELLLGYNPNNPDSDGDGIRDGEEDGDADGLTDAQENVLGLNPRNAYSAGSNAFDGDQDADFDGLINKQEFVLGTIPTNPDTDGDHYIDGIEAEAPSDPLDSSSLPSLFVGGQPEVSLTLISTATGPGLGSGAITVIASPSIAVALPRMEYGAVLGTPPVDLTIPSFSFFGESGTNTGIGAFLASPPISLTIFGPGSGIGETPTTLATPPITVRITP